MRYADFKQLREVHVPGLYGDARKFRSFKLISLNAAMAEIAIEGDWCRFGGHDAPLEQLLQVYAGGVPQRRLHLFDGVDPPQEARAAVAIDPTRLDEAVVTAHSGSIARTLPAFVGRQRRPLAFLHIDCNDFESTRTVLRWCSPLIVPGTVLLFDEFFLPGAEGVADDECRAFHEWTREHGRLYQFLWKTRWVQCAVRVLK